MTFISFQNIIKIMAKYWDKFLIDGVSYTLALSAITVSCGAIFAVILAWMKMADIRPVKLLLGCFGLDCEFMDRGKLGKLFQVRPLRLISTAYIEIIRGTPMLLQLYFFYFALPMLVPILNKQKFACVAIALVCNSAAYLSEVMRSGIQAVDGGQTEAAKSLGLSSGKTMRFIVLPQAIKNILPALGNEFIMVIKDTSLASTFFIGDIMTQYLLVKGTTYLPIEPLVIVGVIYFVMTFILSKLFGFAERKMSRGDKR